LSVPSFLLPVTLIAPPPGALMVNLSPPIGGAAGSYVLTAFSMQTQQANNWCWAAVSVSVAIFFGAGGWTQCRLAGQELSATCCVSPVPGPCDRAWYLDRALARVGHFDRIDYTSEPFSTVQSEINTGRPLGCRIAWAAGLAHFVAIGGWQVASDGAEFVDVFDPYYGASTLPYATFVSGYRSPGDMWTHSYFTLSSAVALGGYVADPSAPLSA
jgi:hypothetical protein